MTEPSEQSPPPGAIDGASPQWPTWAAAWAPPPRPPLWRRAAPLVGVIVAMWVLGAPLGLLWAAVAPSVPVRMTDDGAILAGPQPEEFVAADGWFTLLGFGFGTLAAIAVWVLLRRHRGPVALIAVAVGALGAGVLAWWLGRQPGRAEYERLLDEAPVGATFAKPADLRAAHVEWLFDVIPYVWGDVLVPAFAAAVAYTLLAGWSRFASLRPEPEPEPEPSDAVPVGAGAPLSWDSPETPAPPAAPAPPVPDEAAPPRD